MFRERIRISASPPCTQWNLTLERQVHGNWGIRLSYVGAINKDVWYVRDLTRPAASLIPFSASRRNYSMYNAVSYIDKGGNDSYHALQVGFTHTYSSGLSVMGSFQWVSQITDVWDKANQETTFGQALENPYCRSCQKGKSYLVDPLDFRMNFIYDLPFGKGRQFASNVNRVVNGIIGNWAIAGLVDAKSGRPNTVFFTGRDTSNTNLVGGRADVVSNCNMRPGNGKTAPYLNIACFAIPQNGTFGNAGISPFRNPGMYGVTGTIYKYFPLPRESAKLRINGMFGNAFNHPTWNTVGNNISQPGNFGQLMNDGANPMEYSGTARYILLQAQLQF